GGQRPVSGVEGSGSTLNRGGDDRDRTGDLLVANEALSQLSYIPTNFEIRKLAEREGFEPSKHFHAYTVSNRAPSATRTSLREAKGARAVPSRAVFKWRRERDSNPRCACAHNGFRDRPIQPLSHLSAGENTRSGLTFPGGSWRGAAPGRSAP